MAIGSFLSEDTVEEAQKDQDAFQSSLAAGGVMFVSYIIAGLIPLLPYFFSYGPGTVQVSVVVSLVVLLLLGIMSARYFGMPPWRFGLRMLLLGGAAIAMGIAIGRAVHF